MLTLAAVVVGCGDGGSGATEAAPADASAPDQERAELLVAALGDSITAGSPLWDPDPELRAKLGPEVTERSQYEFWAARADPRLEFRNCGVWGERTDEIARRLEPCARGAEVLIVQGGINDIAQGRPVEEAAADLRSMVRRGLELGLEVAIADVLPWNNGHPRADAPIERLNELIVQIAEDEGVPVLPFHETLEDEENPGLMLERWTIEGDHPSIEGYRRLGELAFELP